VRKNFIAAELKRFDESNHLIEASFLIEIKHIRNLQDCKDELQKISPDVKVVFIDNKGY
jgi:hypothetical protein